MRRLSLFALAAFVLTGCHPKTDVLEPCIYYSIPESYLERLPSAFPPLSLEEREQAFGQEILCGDSFAREKDLYRAITAYKRALVFLPECRVERRDETVYKIILAYYIGGKYQSAIETFEASPLVNMKSSFPAFTNLLLILYESYHSLGYCDRADKAFSFIEKYSPDTAEDLRVGALIQEGNSAHIPETYPKMQKIMQCYCDHALSPRKAQIFNALLPGSGYLYVGQKQSALTSFVINALFITAAYTFFERDYIAAGAITTSLELGWYFGGINGAGLAAKEYNERLYNSLGKEAMLQGRLFPALMFTTAF